MTGKAREYQNLAQALQKELFKQKQDFEAKAAQDRDGAVAAVIEFYKKDMERQNEMLDIALTVAKESIKHLNEEMAKMEYVKEDDDNKQ